MRTKKKRGIAPRESEAPLAIEPPARHLLAVLALCAVTLLAYSNSFGTGFTLDNRGLLLGDPRIREATSRNIGQIFEHTYWWPYAESGLYRPVTTLSYLFNYAVLGNRDRPAGYHWINLLLHAANVLLVYALALRLIHRFWPPVFIAGMWAVHPVLTESVTNMIGRSDLLAAIAVLGGFLMYLKSRETTGRRRLAWLAGLMAVTTLGVFSKESAVAILGVIVLYELTWWEERKHVRSLLLGCLAIVPPILAMWCQRSIVLAASPPADIPFTDNPLIAVDFWTARLTAVKIMARYLSLMVWPAKLSPDYSYPEVPMTRGSLQDWLAWTVIAVIVAAMAISFRRNRAAFFLASFAFVAFLPVSNLLFPIGTIMAERFLYLPSIALAACLVLAIDAAGRRIGAAVFAPLVLCLITAGFAIRTWARNADWKDDVTLGTAAVRACPNSFKTHRLLAQALYESDSSHSNIDRVIEEAEKSMALLDGVPDSLNSVDAYRPAGTYYLRKGDRLLERAPDGQIVTPPESVRAYRRSVEVLLRCDSILKAYHANGKPGFEGPPVRFADAYQFLSGNYLRLRETKKALDPAMYARELAPLTPDMHLQVSDALLAQGRAGDAAVALMEGVFVTGGPKLKAELLNLYQNGLDPKGCAIVPGANGPELNPSCETVHKLLCTASAETMKLHLQTRQPDLARTMKNAALQQFGCPAGPLNQILP